MSFAKVTAPPAAGACAPVETAAEPRATTRASVFIMWRLRSNIRPDHAPIGGNLEVGFSRARRLRRGHSRGRLRFAATASAAGNRRLEAGRHVVGSRQLVDEHIYERRRRVPRALADAQWRGAERGAVARRVPQRG